MTDISVYMDNHMISVSFSNAYQFKNKLMDDFRAMSDRRLLNRVVVDDVMGDATKFIIVRTKYWYFQRHNAGCIQTEDFKILKRILKIFYKHRTLSFSIKNDVDYNNEMTIEGEEQILVHLED